MSESCSETLGTLDIRRLMELLPHRYPFLLVDRIIKVDRDQSAVGIKNVTMNEPYFTGHFPHAPIMPGVMIIEGMAQTAGAICAQHHYGDEQKTVYFMTIDNAKFRKTVTPGDQLEYHIEKLKQRRNIFKFACRAMVDGQLAAEAEVGAMMAGRDGEG